MVSFGVTVVKGHRRPEELETAFGGAGACVQGCAPGTKQFFTIRSGWYSGERRSSVYVSSMPGSMMIPRMNGSASTVAAYAPGACLGPVLAYAFGSQMRRRPCSGPCARVRPGELEKRRFRNPIGGRDTTHHQTVVPPLGRAGPADAFPVAADYRTTAIRGLLPFPDCARHARAQDASRPLHGGEDGLVGRGLSNIYSIHC